jgi:tetratricopeptide (TPR) repeat protein
MTLKTFVYFVFLFVVIAAVALLAYGNNQTVTIHYPFLPDVTIPAWSVIFFSFILGLAVAFIWFLWRGAILMFGRWREKRTTKKEQKIGALFSQAKQLFLTDEIDGARAKFHQVLEKDGGHLPALKYLAGIYRREGKEGDAIPLLEKALARNDRDTEVLLSLADAYGRTGRDEDCREKLLKADSLLGGNYFVRKKLQACYLDRGDLTSAQQNQQAILSLALDDKARALEKEMLYGIHAALAREREKRGDEKGAVKELKKIIKSAPGFAPAYQALADIHLKGGHGEQALSDMEKGYKATKLPFFLKMMENYHLERESPEQAIEAYNKALSTAGEAKHEMPLRYLLGSLYYRLEMIDESLREFDRISSEVQATDPRIQFYNARLHSRKQDYQKAYEQLKEFYETAQIGKYHYRCSECTTMHESWQPRCGHCGAWNTLAFLRFEPSKELEEMGRISSMPIYLP